jgi:hypothetical protein
MIVNVNKQVFIYVLAVLHNALSYHRSPNYEPSV